MFDIFLKSFFLFKTTLDRFINSHFSFLVIYWSAYRDAKLKMANEIKRSLPRDSTRDLAA